MLKQPKEWGHRVTRREPWRGGQLCGWQLSFGDWASGSVFCGEWKAEGQYLCVEHLSYWEAEGCKGFAEGNAVGDSSVERSVFWEPVEDADEEGPVESTRTERWELLLSDPAMVWGKTETGDTWHLPVEGGGAGCRKGLKLVTVLSMRAADRTPLTFFCGKCRSSVEL